MAYAKLAGTKALKTYQAVKIILKAANLGTWLAKPEGRFYDGDNAGLLHGFVIVGGAGSDVYVGVYELHDRLKVEG
jgi:hypothetical protein